MSGRLSPRELAYCGLFGAAALLLPVLFHLVHLGQVFMPMYLPLVTLPFFVRPLPAAVTAALVPLLSGAVTGMPPFYPPVAVLMAVELAVMAALISGSVRLWPRINEWLALIPVLLLGRLLYVGLVYALSRVLALPAGFMAGLSFLSGWPGIILIGVVVPPLARSWRRAARPAIDLGGAVGGQEPAKHGSTGQIELESGTAGEEPAKHGSTEETELESGTAGKAPAKNGSTVEPELERSSE